MKKIGYNINIMKNCNLINLLTITGIMMILTLMLISSSLKLIDNININKHKIELRNNLIK